MTAELVRAELGGATARLYERLVAIAKRPGAPAQLGRIVLNLLCGAYHDYRALAPMPKADLVEALRAVAVSPIVGRQVRALIADVIAGRFADDEAEASRWSERAAPPAPPTRTPALAPPAPPGLSERQRAVLAWVLRFREVYSRSPTGKEIAAGTGLAAKKVGRTIRQLEGKHALVRLEGLIPTRVP